MFDDYIKKIECARVYDVALKTPLEEAEGLSRRIGNRVFLKREDLQPVFSFKLRGAYNKIVNLSADALKHGVITASAGNHAQGVAMSANKLGIESLIVMPRTTPSIKLDSVRNLGGTIVLHGDTYDEACEHAMDLAKQRNMTFIHPYDDSEVIAGQGTIAREILEQLPGDLHAVFIPVGGGGLIAGMAVYLKHYRPGVRLIGVEPHDAPCMYEALKANKRVILDQVGIFADGVAVRQVGEEPFRLASRCVDEVILVNTDEICASIMDIFDETRSIAEPAGALALAGLRKYVERENLSGQTLVAVNSGANMNFDRLRHVAERAEVGERREALLAVTVDERPGSFREFCQVIGDRGITEFNYRFSDPGVAHVFAGIKLTGGDKERLQILKTLKDRNYPVVDMTDNEMAKMHVRYMVGGHAPVAPVAENEKIYRFEFPERPGALLRFLMHMGESWNISMFHYRNHGAAYGRALVGIQVPPGEQAAFQTFLDDVGYTFYNEQDNPAYRLFLG